MPDDETQEAAALAAAIKRFHAALERQREATAELSRAIAEVDAAMERRANERRRQRSGLDAALARRVERRRRIAGIDPI